MINEKLLNKGQNTSKSIPLKYSSHLQHSTRNIVRKMRYKIPPHQTSGCLTTVKTEILHPFVLTLNVVYILHKIWYYEISVTNSIIAKQEGI